jgi:acylphosphatase
MNKGLWIKVNGLVQGVGFRYFMLQRALQLGLTGFVRNLPDGSVEAEAEGRESSLLALLDDVKRGPLGAEVDELEQEWKDYTGSYRGFNITR